MALLNSKIIAKDALSTLGEESALIGASTIQPVQNLGTGTSYMTFRKPAKFIARDGSKTWAGSEIVEDGEELVLSKIYGVDFEISDSDLALTVADFGALYTKPAISEIVTKIEKDFYKIALSKSGKTIDGSVATALDDLFDVGAEQNIRGVTMSDRSFIGDARILSGLMKQGRGLFQEANEIAKQYKAGVTGQIGGYNVWGTGRIPSYANGSFTSASVAVSGTEGSDLVSIAGATAGMVVGTAFTIAGVNELNPTTREDLGTLKVFRVVAVNGGDVVQVDTKLYASSTDARKNVSALPTGTKAVTKIATTGDKQAIAFPKEGVILGFAKLTTQTPGVESEWVEENGVGIRIMKWFDGDSAKMKVRFDAQCGILVPRSELVVSVAAN